MKGMFWAPKKNALGRWLDTRNKHDFINKHK